MPASTFSRKRHIFPDKIQKLTHQLVALILQKLVSADSGCQLLFQTRQFHPGRIYLCGRQMGSLLSALICRIGLICRNTDRGTCRRYASVRPRGRMESSFQPMSSVSSMSRFVIVALRDIFFFERVRKFRIQIRSISESAASPRITISSLRFLASRIGGKELVHRVGMIRAGLAFADSLIFQTGQRRQNVDRAAVMPLR